ncbi:hypothetical protein AAFN75_06415 [Algibacter sp. AS12]|uniref:hypothetical protein n=1 Tax=Algibacter sp. AS12 TaxID=3135773 RepID=UPI00398B12BD
MKKHSSILLALLMTLISYSQMGVGTTFPDESAQLDVVSSDKGILIPRVKLQHSTDTATISANLLDNPLSLLVYNTTPSGDLIEGYHYWNGSKWLKLITSDDSLEAVTTLIDNTDGTFTYTSENNTQTTFNANGNLIDNNNGTFTYTNAANTVTTFDAKLTSVEDNTDGTYTITDDFGVTITINSTTETTTTLIDNNDGTFTYTSEDNTQTTFNADGNLTDNNDGTFTYTNAANTTTSFDAKLTSVVDNTDGTYTITDDFGTSVTFGAATETTTTLVDNKDGTFTYTSEDNTQTTLTSGSLTNNGDGSYTFTDAAGRNTTISASTGLTVEPWNGVDDNGPATDNVEDIYTLGNVGIGTDTPNATLEVKGDIIIGDGGTAIKRSLSATALLDFPDRFDSNTNQFDLTIAVDGAKVGDVVCLGLPRAVMGNYTMYSAWVSAPDEVSVRINASPFSRTNPPRAVFRVTVFQY